MTQDPDSAQQHNDMAALKARILDAVNLTGYPVMSLTITIADPLSFPIVEVTLEASSTDYIPRKTDHV